MGELNKLGGKVRFTSHGEYVLTAKMVDLLGRSYSHSESITIMPIVDFAFTMPTTVHYGKSFRGCNQQISTYRKANAVWTLSKNGESCSYVGELSKNGGTIAINDIGEFTLTAVVTDILGRECRYSQSITLTNTLPVISEVNAVPTRTVKTANSL